MRKTRNPTRTFPTTTAERLESASNTRSCELYVDLLRTTEQPTTGLSLSLHREFWSLLIIHTNKCTFYNIMKYKIHIKIHIKTFKTLLHISILRSSSGSIHYSLLKLYIKKITELLLNINPVIWQRAADCFNI
jgi:hypothetical protein